MENILRDFIKYLEGLEDKDWNVRVNKNWSVKDVVAHLVGWEEECSGVLVDYWKNGEKPWFLKNNNYDNFDKQSIERYKNYSPRKLIERWRFLSKVLDEEISDIGENNLKHRKEFDWIFDDSHYLEHWEQIKKVLRK